MYRSVFNWLNVSWLLFIVQETISKSLLRFHHSTWKKQPLHKFRVPRINGILLWHGHPFLLKKALKQVLYFIRWISISKLSDIIQVFCAAPIDQRGLTGPQHCVNFVVGYTAPNLIPPILVQGNLLKHEMFSHREKSLVNFQELPHPLELSSPIIHFLVFKVRRRLFF